LVLLYFFSCTSLIESFHQQMLTDQIRMLLVKFINSFTKIQPDQNMFELCCMIEEFVTPLSTPPSEAEDAAASDTARHSELGESVTSGLSASAIYDKIYET